MYCIGDTQAIATKELYSYLEQQVQAFALFSIKVKTPQRKANYHDKTRLRRKDLQEIAFSQCGWKSTANVKKYLKVLGVKLDLRLTSAWDALVFELKPQIDEACLRMNNSSAKCRAAKAIVDAPEPPHFQIGDQVNIIDCPANLYFLSPFKIYFIESDMAQLEYVAFPVPLDNLELWAEERELAA